MPKTIKEFQLNQSTGEVSVEYSDDSTSKFNASDMVTAQTDPVTGRVRKASAAGRDLFADQDNFSCSGPFGALRPITNRLVFPEQNTAVLPGSVTTLTYRSRHTIQEDCPFAIFVWANAASPIGTTGNAVTYKASFDYVPAGTGSLNSILPVPMTLAGGQASVTVPFGGIVQSDPVFGPFKKGDTILVRTNVTVADTSKKIPLGMTLNWGWEGTAAGDSTATPNYSISFTSAGPGVSPCAILGRTFRRPAIGIVGDSINDGAGDSGTGPYANLGAVTRAIEGIFGSIKVCAPGERLASTLGTTSSASNYAVRGSLINQCTHIVSNYGTNDVGNGDSLATLQSNVLLFAKRYFGTLPYFAQTLDPRTTSTDSWATTANQTVTANEAVRAGYNSWLRDGAPIDASGVAVAVGTVGATRAGADGHPIRGVIDTAAKVEVNSSNALTLNGGYWIVNGSANYATSDGIHNSAAASILKSTAVDTSMFF